MYQLIIIPSSLPDDFFDDQTKPKSILKNAPKSILKNAKPVAALASYGSSEDEEEEAEPTAPAQPPVTAGSSGSTTVTGIPSGMYNNVSWYEDVKDMDVQFLYM